MCKLTDLQIHKQIPEIKKYQWIHYINLQINKKHLWISSHQAFVKPVFIGEKAFVDLNSSCAFAFYTQFWDTFFASLKESHLAIFG